MAESLLKNGTTRVVLYGSIHLEGTQVLVDLLEEVGLHGYVGKVNMDRNCPDYLKEDTNDSIRNTIKFIERNIDNKNIKPIITPRFIPSCTSNS